MGTCQLGRLERAEHAPRSAAGPQIGAKCTRATPACPAAERARELEGRCDTDMIHTAAADHKARLINCGGFISLLGSGSAESDPMDTC